MDARLTWMVIFPSFTVSVPFPSFASFTWNIPLSVSNSAVYTPSSSVFSADDASFLSSVFSASVFSAFSASLSSAVSFASVLSSVVSAASFASVSARTGLVASNAAEMVSADIINVMERFFMVIFLLYLTLFLSDILYNDKKSHSFSLYNISARKLLQVLRAVIVWAILKSCYCSINVQ